MALWLGAVYFIAWTIVVIDITDTHNDNNLNF